MLSIHGSQMEALSSASPEGAIMPCAGRVDIPALGGEGSMSEGQGFFIPDEYGGSIVYATSEPLASVQVPARKLASVTHNGKVYAPYVSRSYASNGKFVKDCLHTAEEINAQTALKTGDVQSKVAGTSDAFGEDEDEDIAAATRHAVDGAAAPGLGQAYVIVDTEWEDGAGRAPYHAAAVVAVDGADRITLEVFASGSDGRRTEKEATYRMYSTGGGALATFHDHWVANYFTSDVKTVVIEPK
jgi:hypothetical protein